MFSVGDEWIVSMDASHEIENTDLLKLKYQISQTDTEFQQNHI